jgi:hypothetical protein
VVAQIGLQTWSVWSHQTPAAQSLSSSHASQVFFGVVLAMTHSEAPVVCFPSGTEHFWPGSLQPHSLPGRYSHVPLPPAWRMGQPGAAPPVPLVAALVDALLLTAASPPVPTGLPPVPLEALAPVTTVPVVPVESKLNVGYPHAAPTEAPTESSEISNARRAVKILMGITKAKRQSAMIQEVPRRGAEIGAARGYGA